MYISTSSFHLQFHTKSLQNAKSYIFFDIFCIKKPAFSNFDLKNLSFNPQKAHWPWLFEVPSWELTYPPPAVFFTFESMMFLLPRWYMLVFLKKPGCISWIGHHVHACVHTSHIVGKEQF